MINVTKTYLPPIEEYIHLLYGVWDRVHLTNNGPLALELEKQLKDYLGVKHLFFVSNGTIALQIAIKALDLKGEIITTPFSYVATTSSIVWENCKPKFVDIEPDSFTIDADKIESAINENTSAIMATHVFGIPCNVNKIKAIAEKHNLKVIYDAAHSFGVNYYDTSVFNYGDIATASFHATKLFHTVEGGAIVTNDDDLAHKISYMKSFGHKGQESFWGVGINGKNSEVHAAMGLCLLSKMPDVIQERKKLSEYYDTLLAPLMSKVYRPVIPGDTEYNYAYYPVVFESEEKLLQVRDSLNASFIYPRRYFYPSLNTLNYISDQPAPVSEGISSKILCLPLYNGLNEREIEQITTIIAAAIKY
ncbi:DegT/DnrJ/EryC1/StrS family aminotransferase [Botryobacter ruber]|uniref:DegT/DnrJ/EryC1/StrS family aminotransferase n=1 Tax=Botryobacter ruber TaxID=2171629 RepID=UPI000E0B7176|nr:DegT/DnrJ/EryC1/StrS family aminotransferase [Botryobacter ruber]